MKYNDSQRDNKSTGITAKLIKAFCDFFSEHYIQSINHRITEGSFIADFDHFTKKIEEQINQTTFEYRIIIPLLLPPSFPRRLFYFFSFNFPNTPPILL